jgi:hypothetical protein
MPLRVLLVVSVLVVGAGVGALARSGSGTPEVHRPRPGTSYADRDAGSPADDPLAVLHAWDGRRAAAWAAGDPIALGRLYVPRSTARTADLALLRRYTDRGLVVRGLRMQVLRARVVVDRPRALVLEVTERLAAARAGRTGDPRASRMLPAGRPTTHLVRFRKVDGRWLVAAVSAPRPRR